MEILLKCDWYESMEHYWEKEWNEVDIPAYNKKNSIFHIIRSIWAVFLLIEISDQSIINLKRKINLYLNLSVIIFFF